MDANEARVAYPVGARVRLDETSDPFTDLKPGDEGQIAFIDSMGTVHIVWQNGSTLGMIPGQDRFTLVDGLSASS